MTHRLTKPPVAAPAPDVDTLAAAVVKIGDAARKLNAHGLNRRAIVLFLHDMTKLPRKDINAVLDALPKLAGMYCKG